MRSRLERISSASVEGLKLDYVEFYVSSADSAAAWLIDSYGFEVLAVAGGALAGCDHKSVVLRQNAITLVLTEALTDLHPAGLYVQHHGDGVANLGFRVTDVSAALAAAVARGAVPVIVPGLRQDDGVVTATIKGFGDVLHTFAQIDDSLPEGAPLLSGLEFQEPRTPSRSGGPELQRIDHFAVCLEAGQLLPTVEFYKSVLDFEMIFEERIQVGSQAMLSQVVQSPFGDVTLTLIEPDPQSNLGQIDDFLKDHNGPGVQHIAFTSDDIVRSVSTLVGNDIAFLQTPASYYDLLVERLELAAHSVQELKGLNILVDEDHEGQLFQIFTRSVHPRRTLFLEVIQRLGARTFGSGNIKALYEAVELERVKAGTLL